jgi:hypothetical protein
MTAVRETDLAPLISRSESRSKYTPVRTQADRSTQRVIAKPATIVMDEPNLQISVLTETSLTTPWGCARTVTLVSSPAKSVRKSE